MSKTITKQPESPSDGTPRDSPRRPHLRLVYSPGRRLDVATNILDLSPGRQSIGREPEEPSLCVLPMDRCASRTHTLIELEAAEQSVYATDQGSRNGTFLDKVRLLPGQPQRLRDGCVLRVGDSFFVFREAPAQRTQSEVPELVGVSPASARLRAFITRIAAEPASVLILGETGAGKEVIAGAIHRLSKRRGARISVNCAAIPENLAESQFFGHARGAFTGAAPHEGFFRAANRGTLLLDELGEIPISVQAKLLRVLEERAVMPVGSTELLPCDVRVIAATNRDLEEAIRSGRFREDLYARLTDLVLRVPPLRERPEDILLLLAHACGDTVPELPPDSVELLLFYGWPRNVREVFKVASHLRVFGMDDALRARLQAPPPAARSESTPVHGAAEAQRPRAPKSPTREQLEALMARHNGVIQEVADALGYSRRQIGRWLEQFGIDRARYRIDSSG